MGNIIRHFTLENHNLQDIQNIQIQQLLNGMGIIYDSNTNKFKGKRLSYPFYVTVGEGCDFQTVGAAFDYVVQMGGGCILITPGVYQEHIYRNITSLISNITIMGMEGSFLKPLNGYPFFEFKAGTPLFLKNIKFNNLTFDFRDVVSYDDLTCAIKMFNENYNDCGILQCSFTNITFISSSNYMVTFPFKFYGVGMWSCVFDNINGIEQFGFLESKPNPNNDMGSTMPEVIIKNLNMRVGPYNYNLLQNCIYFEIKYWSPTIIIKDCLFYHHPYGPSGSKTIYIKLRQNSQSLISRINMKNCMFVAQPISGGVYFELDKPGLGIVKVQIIGNFFQRWADRNYTITPYVINDAYQHQDSVYDISHNIIE